MTEAMIAQRSLPPKPEARKDNPINAQFEDKAKALLRYAMVQKGIGVDELAARLNEMGVQISAGGLANKISRGGFSSAFLLQCMEAMGINLAPLPR
ncbi:GMP synthase [Rhodomicrobium vannielii ATCC 17100]|uniref:DUF6471 domain-containing protein n=1 Tax=Rhodomicrobium vannielii TaxID=1069 RepID=UPI001919A04C|nr:DUF6471 domain-containing protein [Rhodomicrobium vannielii]MBJ7533778.1 GMP synthase [Rhodomicrobium vannielii ATCC 17100]